MSRCVGGRMVNHQEILCRTSDSPQDNLMVKTLHKGEAYFICRCLCQKLLCLPAPIPRAILHSSLPCSVPEEAVFCREHHGSTLGQCFQCISAEGQHPQMTAAGRGGAKGSSQLLAHLTAALLSVANTFVLSAVALTLQARPYLPPALCPQAQLWWQILAGAHPPALQHPLTAPSALFLH